MATTIGNTLFGENFNVIQETIGDSVYHYMAAEDDVFRDLIFNTGVQAFGPEELGRDLKFKKRYDVPVGGVIEPGSKTNDFMVTGDAMSQVSERLNRATLTKTFPKGTEGLQARNIPITMTMTSELSTIFWPASVLRLEALPANINEYVVPALAAFGKQISRRKAHQWYSREATQHRLGSLGPSSGAGAYAIDTSARRITFQPPEETSQRFTVGERVDIMKEADLSATSSLTEYARVNESSTVRVRLWVESVDPWTNTVVLVGDGKTEADANITWGTIFSTGTLGNASFVTLADVYTSATGKFHSFYGYDAFLKTGNAASANQNDRYILGSGRDSTEFIDITIHPEFRSGYWGNVGDLTERKMLAYLQTIERVFGADESIDTIIASTGATLNMFDQFISQERRERDGPTKISLGLQNKPTITTVRGNTYTITESDWMETGRMIGIAGPGNWGMFVPPDPSGAQTAPYGSPSCPYRLHLPEITGGRMALWPSQNTNAQLLDGSEQPGYIRMQMFPTKQMRGVVWEGVNVRRVYSEIS